MAIDKKMMWAFWGLVALVVIGLVLMVVSGLRRAPKGASDGSVALTIPDGEAQPVADSKSAAMRGAVSLDKYFGELPPEGASGEVSLVSGAASAASSEPRAAESDEAVVARTFGVPASTSGRHSGGSSRGGRPASRPMSQEERLEYERKRAEMVKEVLSGGSSASEEISVTEDAPEKEILRFAQNDGDGIITTLDDEPSEGVGYGIRPFRCMFVRDEKLRSGQRVTLRLLEELAVDGVVVPANTHLQAICKIGERLELSVRSLELGGRIVPLLLEAYDSDGLPGIYCPETSAAKNARKASDEAITTAGRTFGGLVGDLASTVIRTGASIARSASGEMSVSVVSGYEFYLVKSERK